MKLKTMLFTIVLIVCFGYVCKAQSVGIGTTTPNADAQLDVAATNKGILIPRIDYNGRPTTGVVSGMMIYVIANGPIGNNAFYYYNGSAWRKFTTGSENQSLSLAGTSLTISSGSTVSLAQIFPIEGYIKCDGSYINPYNNNFNCGTCGHVCAGGQPCKNGICQ